MAAQILKRQFSALASIEEVRQLSWRQFESIIGEAFRRRGYTVMENAVDGPDGGVDLVLRAWREVLRAMQAMEAHQGRCEAGSRALWCDRGS